MRALGVKSLWITGSFALLSVAVILLSQAFDDIASRWPSTVAVVLLFTCALEAATHLRTPGIETSNHKAENLSEGWKTLLLTLGFGAITFSIGMFPAAAVFICTHLIWIGRKSVLIAAVTTIGALLVLYGLFEHALGLSLYRGVFFA